MSSKSWVNLIWIAALLLGAAFTALPTAAVSADSGAVVSAATLEKLDKAHLAQVKELAYQKELLQYAKDRLEIVVKLQDGFKKTDPAYNTLQWYINSVNTRIANAEAAIQKTDKLLKEHKGFEIAGYGFQVYISKITDLTVAEATIKSATEQVALSGTNLRRSMRLIKAAIKEFKE